MDRNPVLRATDSSPGAGLVAGGEKMAKTKLVSAGTSLGMVIFPYHHLVRGFLTHIHMEMGSGG